MPPGAKMVGVGGSSPIAGEEWREGEGRGARASPMGEPSIYYNLVEENKSTLDGPLSTERDLTRRAIHRG